jgi:hypothetical protein
MFFGLVDPRKGLASTFTSLLNLVGNFVLTMTNVAAVLLSLFPLLLSRARASCDENLSQFEARSFLWENGLPKFIDSHDNLCNLTSNKTRDQVGVRYNVLSFGDSYELEFCRVRPFGLQYHPQSQPHIYGDCSFQNESINYKLHRGYGQQGDPKGTWKWCNESSVSAIAKMGKYFDESTSTPSASFGAVVLVGSLRFAQRLVYR